MFSGCSLFSHSLDIVFHRTEVFKFRLSIISFTDRAFGVISKKSSLHPRSSRFCLMLSFRSFIVSYFTFWSMIHLEVIFMKGRGFVSRFIYLFLHVDILFFQYDLLKRLSSSNVLPLLLCQRSVDYIYVGLFLGCVLCYIYLCVYSFANTSLPCYWSFTLNLGVR